MRAELPGFVDLQVNGFAGVDFNRPDLTPEGLHRAILALEATGVTRLLPTLITSSREVFQACARTIAACSDPAVAGIHMEGPYISADDGPRGAHPEAFVRPASWDDFQRRQEAAGGRIVLVTLAPEIPGALELCARLTAAGVRVALGHTAATPEEIRAAVAAGAVLSTHLGNGCGSPLPRHPNFLWEQLAADELGAGLIVDGIHLSPSTVKVMVRAKTPSRILLVSDAVAAAGCPPGRYTLGGEEVELDAAGRVTRPGTARLAGSALTLPRAVANLARFAGLGLAEAAACATSIPAALLGIEPAGRIVAEWDGGAGRLEVIRVEVDKKPHEPS